MSAVRTVLLLWVFVGAIVSTYGALVISRDTEVQDNPDRTRHIKKRSVSDVEIEVQSVRVDCKVASRFAHTVMTTKALNKGNSSKEIFFEVDLPKTAFITNFSMEIDGETYVGEIKEKEKAKKQYEKAVSSGQTAGLIKASGRKMEKFSVSVNIAAYSNVTFTLSYEELLKRRLGNYEITTRVKPKQLVQNFEIVADIYEPQGIAFLDANATFITNELLPLVEKTVTDKTAHVSFSPTLDQQRKCPDCDGTLIDGDFFIKYDVNRDDSIGDIQIVNGYFVHYFAPADLPRVPKNVVFVIDISGSMSGHKMEQTKEALLTILSDLNEDDYFGLVLFDDEIEPWRPSLTKATEDYVATAKEFVKTIEDRGSTNINDAVLKAVEMLMTDKQQNLLPENSVSMVILLTDGQPTSGETDTEVIQENVQASIDGNVTLFCLGFGYDLDYGFLDTMAKQNDGLARRIYEASDAVVQLQGFYEEVASPLLSDVLFRYPEDAVHSLTNSHFKQLFNGSEIVVAGQLIENDMENFLIEVSGHGVDEYVIQGQSSAQEWDIMFPEQEYIFGEFTERLWAYLTIEQLLDRKDKGSPEERANATAEALDLSLKYNFVTPLTSMVVTKPENEENPDDVLIADKLTEEQRTGPQAQGFHPPAQYANYRLASAPRGPPAYFDASSPLVDGDPHFIIELPEKNDALCFNIDDEPGTVLTLVRDPELGIVVNGETIGDKKVDPGSKVNTYFGRFGIVHQNLGIRLVVSTKEISVTQDSRMLKLQWSHTASVKGANMDLQVTKDHSLTVTLKDSVKFVIILHKVWKKHPYHQDYLGFYTIDGHLLSPSVHGLLGQFYHGVQFEVSDTYPGKDQDKPDASMFIKGKKLTVTRGWQRDFRKDVKNGEKVPCWFIHNNGTGLIDGSPEDYVVSSLI
ncbi:inter-alpha-trypsin inhibitor heavy chain H3-like [Clupea harengus]|uniref:Inter-alpha-trypsin inhibitor heavy chain H3 n=1 Tax=Clupea harengus TaxID=7950 RepID=A0A6P8FC39_CLUHA|nr:inter-alpha-trypsin inhibitor heavy chain H3-like [Clupea harengus]